MAPSPGACWIGCWRSPGCSPRRPSGTSAGAMNAAVLADGHAMGGAEDARAALEAFAQGVRRRSSARCGTPLDVLLGRWTSTIRLRSSPWISRRVCSRPTTLTPAGPTHCARSWPKASTSSGWRAPIQVFVTATDVRTGRGRLPNREITPDVLLASACLPTLFQAVEIDGAAYWDGGYSGNPTITPLVWSARRRTSSSSRSTRSSGRARRAPPARSSTASTRFLQPVLLKELRMMALLRRSPIPASARAARCGRACAPTASPARRWSSSAIPPS